MATNVVRFDAIRSASAASISAGAGSYITLDIPFAHAMRVVHIINSTDGDMMISFDGIIDNIIVLAGGFSLYDLTSDEDAGEMFRYINGTQLYVRYVTAPTTGSVYAVCVYGKGE